MDGEAAGTIRLIRDEKRLTRLAVLKKFRTLGLGRVLVQALEGYVTENWGGVVEVHSQVG